MVALYLVPFLSVNADDSNIFENGAVTTIPSDLQNTWTAVCISDWNTSVFGGDGKFEISLARQKCATLMEGSALAYYKQRYPVSDSYECSDSTSVSGISIVVTRTGCSRTSFNKVTTYNIVVSSPEQSKTISCPPTGYESYSYGHDSSGNGDYDTCSDPVQISQVDSCNASSGNEYLTIEVSAPSGCFPQPDGSSCKYNAVDVGGGNQYYALDLEGDCYSDNELPNLEGTPENSPVGEQCADYGGGVVGCPEDPENVCTSGSSYAGGSVQDCQTGCGMVNDQFMCIDQDSDSDGVPDYKDEDSNENTDCPVGETCDESGGDDGGNSGGECPEGETCNGGGGGGGGEFDDSGIVAELKKSNEFLETIEGQFKTDHGKTPDELNKDGRLDTLDNDYKLELEEFIAKGSKELGYIDELKLANMSTFAGAVTNRGCNAQSIDIPGYGNWSIDFCELSSKVEPILYFVFAILTVSFIFYRVNDTLRL